MDKKKDFHSFLNEHKGIIAKVCRIYTDTENDFEDYFQEVAIQLWRSFGSFRGESKTSTWVYRIALNVCLTQLKKQRRKKIPTTTLDSARIITQESGDPMQEKIKWLYDSIKKLKELDRAIILLYLEDKSYKEMAEILGMTVSNVGVKVNRVKSKLKKWGNG